jgi:hypothetical protein
MRSIGGFSKSGLLGSWERGRPVRIEREARTFLAKRTMNSASFARCADGTSALPVQNKSFDLMGQLAHNSLPLP